MRRNESNPGVQLEAALKLAHLKFNMTGYNKTSAFAVVFVDLTGQVEPVGLNIQLQCEGGESFKYVGTVGNLAVTYQDFGHPDYNSASYEFSNWGSLVDILRDRVQMVANEVQLILAGVRPSPVTAASKVVVDLSAGSVSGAELKEELIGALKILHWTFNDSQIQVEDFKVLVKAFPFAVDWRVEVSISTRKTDLFKSGEALLQVQPCCRPSVYDRQDSAHLAKLIDFLMANS